MFQAFQEYRDKLNMTPASFLKVLVGVGIGNNELHFEDKMNELRVIHHIATKMMEKEDKNTVVLNKLCRSFFQYDLDILDLLSVKPIVFYLDISVEIKPFPYISLFIDKCLLPYDSEWFASIKIYDKLSFRLAADTQIKNYNELQDVELDKILNVNLLVVKKTKNALILRELGYATCNSTLLQFAFFMKPWPEYCSIICIPNSNSYSGQELPSNIELIQKIENYKLVRVMKGFDEYGKSSILFDSRICHAWDLSPGGILAKESESSFNMLSMSESQQT